MTSLIDLFGTDEPQPQRRTLTAGQLSVVLEAGNLRDIRFGGVEILRAVNYLARDTSWGTYAAVLADEQTTEAEGRFSARYTARCEGPQGRLDYVISITGDADGTLVFRAEATAITDFPTNRVGFVLLHPAEAAGTALRIEQADGTLHDIRFPDLIDPNPPALNIVAMTHHPLPALTVRVAMHGDAFEMEDQRNWGDASFKTFVRPLSRPRPYVIAKGMRDVQSVTLQVSGAVRHSRPAMTAETLTLGPVIGAMPQMALFCDRSEACARYAAQLGDGIANLVIPRWQADAPEVFHQAIRLAAAIGAEVAVEAIFVARDPDAEVQVLRATLEAAGLADATVLIAPARELRTSPSGSRPAGEVATDDIVAALHRAGHRGRIGAGTPSYFPEFNRNPPGPAADFVYFGNAATIHAADDASVIEMIGVTSAILRSAHHRAKTSPIWFGPCTLAMRHTPYGASLAPNPLHIRMPVAADDPRHFALFGAAFAVGVAAKAVGSIACLTLAAPFGPFGLLNQGRPTALSAVQRLLARAAGRQAITVASGEGCAALGWIVDGQHHMLAANLGPKARTLILPPGASQPEMVTHDGQWAATDVRADLPPYRTIRFCLK